MRLRISGEACIRLILQYLYSASCKGKSIYIYTYKFRDPLREVSQDDPDNEPVLKRPASKILKRPGAKTAEDIQNEEEEVAKAKEEEAAKQA